MAAKTFIFFAQVLWPVWAPFSIYKFEKQEGVRSIVGKSLIGIGGLVAIIMAFYLFTNPITAEILGHHISYNQAYLQQFGIIGGILYLAASAMPPFILHRIRKMWILRKEQLFWPIFLRKYSLQNMWFQFGVFSLQF